MTPNPATTKVLETLAALQTDLNAAQQGPMNPKLRSELARMATATDKSLTEISASQEAAMTAFAAKQEKAAQLAALNQQLIAKKKAALAAKQQPNPTLPAIDPTLGRRLGEELLGRQQRELAVEPHSHALGLLDDWDLTQEDLARSNLEAKA